MSGDKEIAMPLKQIHKLFSEVNTRVTYSTLVTYSSRNDEFPKPYSTSLTGKGLGWFPSEIIFFLKNKKDNRGIHNHKQINRGFKLDDGNAEICNNKNCKALIPVGEERIQAMKPNSAVFIYYHLECAKALGVIS